MDDPYGLPAIPWLRFHIVQRCVHGTCFVDDILDAMALKGDAKTAREHRATFERMIRELKRSKAREWGTGLVLTLCSTLVSPRDRVRAAVCGLFRNSDGDSAVKREIRDMIIELFLVAVELRPAASRGISPVATKWQRFLES